MTYQLRTLVSMALIPAALAVGFVHSAARAASEPVTEEKAYENILALMGHWTSICSTSCQVANSNQTGAPLQMGRWELQCGCMRQSRMCWMTPGCRRL